MRYLVTGGTGFIGGEVVRQLRAAGDAVVALVREPGRAHALRDIGAELATGDVTQPETVRAAMAGVDGVFHIAGWYKVGVRDSSEAWAINVDGTRNVLAAMRDLGIGRGVYTSTLAVFSDTHGQIVDERYRHNGPWLSVYDHTKWAAHYEVAEPMIQAGLPLIVVQPGAVYGVGDQSALGDALRAYLRRRLPAVPGGTAYCWGHVEDTARAHILAMQCGTPGESYIIAGPAYTLMQALRIAQDITGIPPPRIVAPPALMRTQANLLGALERLPFWPGLGSQWTAEYMRIAAGVTYLGSNAKARRDLGYEPRSLEAGFREVLLEELRRLQSR
jgi:nucleoside-diphosphate-sugar epimerase